MRTPSVLAAAIVGSTVFPGAALATDHGHDVALTISPVHLGIPIVEVTGEYALERRLGFAVIGGYGTPTVILNDGERVKLTAIEFGASGRYYLFGSFDHGMQIGAEVLYIHVSGEADAVRATASGLSLAPFIGYKKSAKFGLTFDAQLGVSYTVVRASSESDSGAEGDAESEGAGILLNLNLGWAF